MLEIAIKEQVLEQYCKDLAETKFKNKRLFMVKLAWVKQKLAKEIAKSGARKDIYKH